MYCQGYESYATNQLDEKEGEFTTRMKDSYQRIEQRLDVIYLLLTFLSSEFSPPPDRKQK